MTGWKPEDVTGEGIGVSSSGCAGGEIEFNEEWSVVEEGQQEDDSNDGEGRHGQPRKMTSASSELWQREGEMG